MKNVEIFAEAIEKQVQTGGEDAATWAIAAALLEVADAGRAVAEAIMIASADIERMLNPGRDA